MELHKLCEQDKKWFVEVAAKAMLVEEMKRPDMVNIPHMTAIVDSMIQQQTAWVVKKNGVCVGGVGSLILPNMFNPDIKNLVEVFWYVLPEYRNTRAGYSLLNVLIDTSDELNLELLMTTLASSAISVKSLEKRGFKLIEYMYRYRKER